MPTNQVLGHRSRRLERSIADFFRASTDIVTPKLAILIWSMVLAPTSIADLDFAVRPHCLSMAETEICRCALTTGSVYFIHAVKYHRHHTERVCFFHHQRNSGSSAGHFFHLIRVHVATPKSTASRYGALGRMDQMSDPGRWFEGFSLRAVHSEAAL